MVDLRHNGQFDIVPGAGGDLPVVTGIEEFEQLFANYLVEEYFEQIGDINHPNVIERIELIAKRFIRESEYGDSVSYIEPYFPEYAPGTLRMRMAYTIDREAFDRPINVNEDNG